MIRPPCAQPPAEDLADLFTASDRRRFCPPHHDGLFRVCPCHPFYTGRTGFHSHDDGAYRAKRWDWKWGT